jgi:hypothetical protein
MAHVFPVSTPNLGTQKLINVSPIIANRTSIMILIWVNAHTVLIALQCGTALDVWPALLEHNTLGKDTSV